MVRFLRVMAVLLGFWAPLLFSAPASSSVPQAAAAVLPGRPAAREAVPVTTLCAHGGLLWSADQHLTRQALRLIYVIRTSDSFGLQPEDYGLARITAAAQRLQAGNGADTDWRDFDCLLSQAAVRLLTHLHYGRVDPATAGFELPARPADLNVTAAVTTLAQSPDIGAAVEAVEPRFYHYALLKAALARYRALKVQPALTQLPSPEHKSVRPGDRYIGTPALRRLLLTLGDLAPAEVPLDAEPVEQRLDPYLVTAIKRFQQRHSLAADGALGGQTDAALSTPMSQRVRQIELTLERWRWLPALNTPPVIVNIPQFQLFAFRTTADRVAEIQQMPVIVGKSYPRTRTPVFVGSLKYVIFRPFWDIPHQITVHEVLPQWRAHPDYLARNHFEIVRGEEVVPDQGRTPAALAALASGEYRLRQRPGDDNAPGPVKFVFPNEHDIYLHGTPAHQLFAQSRRAFSHSCIRVADPVALAAYVLRNTPGNWNTQKITAAMQGSQSTRVNLAQPIPVMTLYGTALATEAGTVEFFDDLYGNDQRLARLLWPATRP